jgi:phage terminase large subunit-like protein
MRRPKTAERKTPPRSTSDPVTAWARAVVAGDVVAGPHVRNACRRHLDDLKRGARRGLVWDLEAAKRVIAFFPDALRLAKGKFEGAPFALHPAQQFVIGSLFGWKRKATAKRRFRRAYIEQGKGNGKSPMAAGIGMYCLTADGEAGAEIYAAASKKDQAQVCFQAAVAMYRQSPALLARLTPSGSNPVWNLAYLASGGFFRPISSENGQSGPLPSCALCDEVHEHPNGDVIEMLERGFKSRQQPLLVMITNSGSDRNSVCWEEHVNAIRAAAGNRDLHGRQDEGTDYLGDLEAAADLDDTFSFVCSLDKDDDPLTDPSCWVKPNPLLGVTMPRAELERAVRQAAAMPSKLNNVLRLHFCVWTDAERAWISRKALEPVLADFDPAEHKGKRIYAAIDLSAAQDLTVGAFCVETGSVEVAGPDGATAELPTYDLWIEAWTPGDTLRERSLRDKAPYDVWAEAGFLNAPPGKRIRLDFVAARLAAISAEYEIALLAYDRYAYAKLGEELAALNVELLEVEHAQGGKRRGKIPEAVAEAARRARAEPPLGLWMPGSLGLLETLIVEGRVRLRRNPVLIAAAMAAATEEDAFGNRWFSKRRATNRIDAVVSAAMCVGAAASGIDKASGDGPRVFTFG